MEVIFHLMIYRLVKGLQNTLRFTQNVRKMSRLNVAPAFGVSRLNVPTLPAYIRQFKVDLEGIGRSINFYVTPLKGSNKRDWAQSRWVRISVTGPNQGGHE